MLLPEVFVTPLPKSYNKEQFQSIFSSGNIRILIFVFVGTLIFTILLKAIKSLVPKVLWALTITALVAAYLIYFRK